MKFSSTRNKMNYKEQLKTPEWAAKRQIILARDGRCCTECGKNTYLQVHHNYYEDDKLAWEYPNEALRTLCRGCHHKFHKTHTLSNHKKVEHFTVYQKYFESFYILKESEYLIFMYCCKNMEFDTNEIMIRSIERREMVHDLGISKQTVSKSLTSLVSKHYLLKDKGIYLVNPMLVWKGREQQRVKLINLNRFAVTVPDYFNK